MSQDQRPGRMRVAVSRDTVPAAKQPAEVLPVIIEQAATGSRATTQVSAVLLLLCGLVAGTLAGAVIAYFGLFGSAHP